MSRLASTHDLGGFVHNDGEGVFIEIEGGEQALARFVDELPSAAPPLARIDHLETRALVARGDSTFCITESPDRARTGKGAAIPPDVAPCGECLRELSDPRDRRFGYPFINCTGCGPRFSIVREVPYDRQRTTMDAFTLCPRCAREYHDDRDRRFHAEPNACPTCGPQLTLLGPGFPALRGSRALAAALAVLARGGILALKGLGGFVLAVNAGNGSAVGELRRRKRRPHKPLAVMARDLTTVAAVAQLDPAARLALSAPARPIVLCPLLPGVTMEGVAPRLREVGFFLPPTPLQHLLLQQGPPLQVMTSGNRSDEPIAKDNDDALARLGPLADAFLLHDRVIHTRVDDSVVRVVAGEPRLLRRARGYVPAALELPVKGPPVLAVGAQMKATVCLAYPDKDAGKAVLSQHLGELGELETFRFFEETVAKLERLLDLAPAVIAHDLHPDCRSTRWAQARGLPLSPVQHHHAHVAACLAEHGRTGPAIGVAFDGTGYGEDGQIWGGEFFEADLGSYVRRGHLRPLALPGGEAAIRHPVRLALAALADAGEPLELLAEVPPLQRQQLAALLAAPGVLRASAAGRWFDAAAALCGLATSEASEISYDGQAPCELEALAAPGEHGSYPFAIEDAGALPFVVDLRPTIAALCAERRRDRPAALLAARFHDTMAEVIRAGCRRLRAAGAPALVALGGGCFANRRLSERVLELLLRDGFEVLLPARVPAGDGGLSLGQAAVASFRAAASAGKAVQPCV